MVTNEQYSNPQDRIVNAICAVARKHTALQSSLPIAKPPEGLERRPVWSPLERHPTAAVMTDRGEPATADLTEDISWENLCVLRVLAEDPAVPLSMRQIALGMRLRNRRDGTRYHNDRYNESAGALVRLGLAKNFSAAKGQKLLRQINGVGLALLARTNTNT